MLSNNNSHIANINSFRYRSYYYDKETKLYYLNSRYYNPMWGRFINADGIINGNKDILSYNLYIYCSNDPINNIDSSGKKWFKSIWNFAKNVGKAIINNAEKLVIGACSAVAGIFFPNC